jgi:hypothetical protein
MAKVTILPTSLTSERKPFKPFTLTIETETEANSLWHRLNAEKALFTDYIDAVTLYTFRKKWYQDTVYGRW